MKSLGLAVARLAICAWLGAATLFVVTSVREVRSPALDSTDRDVLVAVRFPAFYTFGFALIGAGAVGSIVATRHAAFSPGRARVVSILLGVALALMIFDYLKIYSPLLAMVTPPGNPRTADFDRFHHWSEQINGVGLTLCAIAALLLVWPAGQSPGAENPAPTST